jgi:hypothetical protein
MQNPNLTMRAMIITLIIFGLIMVVAYFARQKITSWRTYAASSVRTLSAVDDPEPRWRGARPWLFSQAMSRSSPAGWRPAAIECATWQTQMAGNPRDRTR